MLRPELNFFILLVLGSQVSCFYPARSVDCYVFPSDRKGWMKIEHGRAEGSFAEMKQGCYWFDFSETNEIITSRALETGWATDRIYIRRKGKLENFNETSTSAKEQAHFLVFEGNRATTWIFWGTASEFKSEQEPPNTGIKN